MGRLQVRMGAHAVCVVVCLSALSLGCTYPIFRPRGNPPVAARPAPGLDQIADAIDSSARGCVARLNGISEDRHRLQRRVHDAETFSFVVGLVGGFVTGSFGTASGLLGQDQQAATDGTADATIGITIGTAALTVVGEIVGVVWANPEAASAAVAEEAEVERELDKLLTAQAPVRSLLLRMTVKAAEISWLIEQGIDVAEAIAEMRVMWRDLAAAAPKVDRASNECVPGSGGLVASIPQAQQRFGESVRTLRQAAAVRSGAGGIGPSEVPDVEREAQ